MMLFLPSFVCQNVCVCNAECLQIKATVLILLIGINELIYIHLYGKCEMCYYNKITFNRCNDKIVN